MTACSLWCSTTKRAFKVMLLSVTPGKHVVGAACLKENRPSLTRDSPRPSGEKRPQLAQGFRGSLAIQPGSERYMCNDQRK